MGASKQNFLQAHWDWLAALAGIGALAASGVMFMQAVGVSPEDGAAEYADTLKTITPAHDGVAEADISVLAKTFRGAQTPPSLAEVDPKKANFLASERRVICRKGDESAKGNACGQPIPAGAEKCPLCGMKQSIVKVEVDTDHDGMPNDWEKKFAFNPSDPKDALLDADKDGFTNLEEYQAGTDPRDAKSHPDYLEFLSVAGGLKQTTLPFYFNAVTPIPGGHRFTFKRLGVTGFDSKVYVKLNDEVSGGSGKNAWKSGWKVTAYEQKEEKRKLAGTTMMKTVDVSTVTVSRLSDGKTLVARINDRNIAIESQAEIKYDRGEGKTFVISEGSEFSLNDCKYRVKKLGGNEQACEVTLIDLATKKEKILR